MKTLFCLCGILGFALVSAKLQAETTNEHVITIMDFETTPDVEPGLAMVLHNALTTEILSMGGVTVVDWREIDKVTKLMAQSQPLVSEEDARKMAINQKGIAKVYMGSIAHVGDKFRLAVKVLNLDLSVERLVTETALSAEQLELSVKALAVPLLGLYKPIPWRTLDGNEGSYEGMLQDGKPHGYGCLTKEAGDRRGGRWREGMQEGAGFSVRKDGSFYEGNFREDRFDGEGHLGLPNGFRYTGQWKKGLMDGEGKATYANGSSYSGAFRNGKPHGQGSLVYTDGVKYDGEFVDGEPAGKGTFVEPSGKTTTFSQ